MSLSNRQEAGRRLAEALEPYRASKPNVLALPRGGAPVAAEVANPLGAPLDLFDCAQDRSPWTAGTRSWRSSRRERSDRRPKRERHPPSRSVRGEVRARQQGRDLRNPSPQDPVSGQSIASRTGRPGSDRHRRRNSDRRNIRAALRALRKREPRLLVLAVPVAPTDTIDALRGEADRVEYLEIHDRFGAIGQYYSDFRQVSDDEVIRLLVGTTAKDYATSAAPEKPDSARSRDYMFPLLGQL
jgi:putative phosphoribosyl transferase